MRWVSWLVLGLALPWTPACGQALITDGAVKDEAVGGSDGVAQQDDSHRGGGATGGQGGASGSQGGARATGGSRATGSAQAAGGARATGGASGDSPLASRVRWVGRVDASDPAAVQFAWSGTGFIANIEGSAISVKLKTQNVGSNPPYFQAVVDGELGERFVLSEGEQTVRLATDLAPGDHTVELYRETEGQYAATTFEGVVDGTLKSPPADPGRLIEIVGDSISAGYGNLGEEQHPNYGADPTGGCHFSTETESAYQTYGARAGRALQADVSVVAISGWGIYRNYDGNTSGNLPSIYANTLGTASTPAWGFSPSPQAVVINLGTNDFAKGEPGEDQFKDAYRGLVSTIRGKYPDAWIFCTVGPLLWGTGLASAQSYLQAIVSDAKSAGDARVQYLDFGQQDTSKGTGCDYHPNLIEHQAMADVLVPALQSALGW